jgi:hypothetical protein
MEKQINPAFAPNAFQKKETKRIAKNQPPLTICISNRQNNKYVKYFDLAPEMSERDVPTSDLSYKDNFEFHASNSGHKISINSTTAALDSTVGSSNNVDKSGDSFYTLLLYLDRILHLDEIDRNVKKLERAIILKNIDEFIAIASHCLQISSNCGMFHGTKPLRRLVELKVTRSLADAEILYQQIKNEYGNSKFRLNINLKQIETCFQKKNAN